MHSLPFSIIPSHFPIRLTVIIPIFHQKPTTTTKPPPTLEILQENGKHTHAHTVTFTFSQPVIFVKHSARFTWCIKSIQTNIETVLCKMMITCNNGNDRDASLCTFSGLVFLWIIHKCIICSKWWVTFHPVCVSVFKSWKINYGMVLLKK